MTGGFQHRVRQAGLKSLVSTFRVQDCHLEAFEKASGPPLDSDLGGLEGALGQVLPGGSDAGHPSLGTAGGERGRAHRRQWVGAAQQPTGWGRAEGPGDGGLGTASGGKYTHTTPFPALAQGLACSRDLKKDFGEVETRALHTMPERASGLANVLLTPSVEAAPAAG